MILPFEKGYAKDIEAFHLGIGYAFETIFVQSQQLSKYLLALCRLLEGLKFELKIEKAFKKILYS
jgi:hypothetical protein